MIWATLRRWLGSDEPEAQPAKETPESRFEALARRTREETDALAEDGKVLAARVKRNTDRGRILLGGRTL